MTATELAAFVKRLAPPFLQCLDAEQFNAVLGSARQQRFLAKSVITNQGHPANQVGHASIYRLGRVQIKGA